jgi:hypothetical protein
MGSSCMTSSEISKLLRALPFEPLMVQLRDGQMYEIRRPGMAIVTPTTLAIGVSRGNGSRLAERIVRCAISDISAVELSTASQ